MFFSYYTTTGNELVAEDVDIGGNEPPVSSCPPVEKQKDSGRRSNKCISPGSSSGNKDLSFYINYVWLSYFAFRILFVRLEKQWTNYIYDLSIQIFVTSSV